MPIIQQYDQRVQAQGQVGGQASSADFGAQVGQAQQALGAGFDAIAQGAEKVGNDVYAVEQQKIQAEQNDAMVNAYTAVSKNNIQLTKNYQDEVQSLPVDDPIKYREALNSINDKYTNPETGLYFQSVNQLATNAPNSVTAKMITRLGTRSAIPFLSNVTSISARNINESYKIQADQIAKNNDTYLSMHAGDPSAFQSVHDMTVDAIGSMKTDGFFKLKLQEDLLNKAAISAISPIAASPQGAVSLLNSVHAGGGYITKGGMRRGVVPGGDYASVATKLMPGLISAESNGNQSAVSSEGAIGVAQIMPSTGPEAAKLAGVQWDENRFKNDPNYNKQLGQAYLTQQLRTFGNDPEKALAAYNWGPGAVKDAVNMYGDNWLQHAPTETQKYVAKVLDSSGSQYPQIQPATEEQAASANLSDLPAWQYLNHEQRVHFTRIAESTVGGQMANGRGQITQTLKDVHAASLIGDGMSDEQKRILDPAYVTQLMGDQAGPVLDMVKQAQTFASFYNGMKTMPTAVAQMSVDSLKPEPGAENYEEKLSYWNHAQRALAKRQEDIKQDPMQYAVNNGIGGAQPLDISSQENLTNSIVSRLSVNHTMEQDYDASLKSTKGLLTKSEAEMISSFLETRPPEDQMMYLTAIQNATQNSPEVYTGTLGQISKHSSELAYVGGLLSQDNTAVLNHPSERRQAAKQILQGLAIAKEGKEGKIPFDHFNKVLDQTLSGVFANPSPEQSAAMQNNTGKAAYLWLNAELRKTGTSITYDPSLPADDAKNKDATDYVNKALNAVTGGIVETNGSKLIKPFDMSETQFKNTVPVYAKNALIAHGFPKTAMDITSLKFKNTPTVGQYMITDANNVPFINKMSGRPVYVDLYGREGN